MPIYEYRCDNCGHEFETIQKVSEAPPSACPACEKPALRKKVSAAGFRLKGGGWYETDFKSDKKRNVAGEEKATKDGGGKEGDKKPTADGGKSGDAAGSKSAGDGAKDSGKKSGGEGKGSGGSSGSKATD